MSALVSLQQAFQNHLLKEDEGITSQLICPVNGLLDERLAVYANGYHWRLLDALEKEYGVLHTHLGDERFAELSEVYIDEYPSRFYSISQFTKQFPQFLATCHEEAYLSELAAIICALSLSLEAADAPFLSHSLLSGIPTQNWPSLCFRCHPSVQFLNFQWNTFAFWKALVQKAELPALHKENSYCIVWRKELQSYAMSLTESEAIAFQAFQTGACFADVCASVYASGIASETQAATLVANCLTRCLDNQWFSEVYIS